MEKWGEGKEKQWKHEGEDEKGETV